MSEYEIVDVENSILWDSLVESSPQGTIFSLSCYLNAVGKPYERFLIKKGNEIKAGFCYLLDSTEDNACVLDDLVIYNGLFFIENSSQKATKARLERFEITNFAIQFLDQRFNRIELSLAPQIEDLRPFLWHNYHSKKSQDRFKTDLRYTSYLDISEMGENQDEEKTVIFQNLQTIRQRNIREAKAKGAYVEIGYEIGYEIDTFIGFYDQLMKSQGDPASKEKLERMAFLVQTLIGLGKAFLAVAKDQNGRILYVVINGMDSKRGYYLFGAGNADADVRYKGTIAFWESFKILSRDYGIGEVDLEGVNSPHRGRFKLSFGGDLKSYYQVIK